MNNKKFEIKLFSFIPIFGMKYKKNNLYIYIFGITFLRIKNINVIRSKKYIIEKELNENYGLLNQIHQMKEYKLWKSRENKSIFNKLDLIENENKN